MLSLQLLQNYLISINTLLIEQIVEREGMRERFRAEDLRGMLPLFHGHINPFGQFALELSGPSPLKAACELDRSPSEVSCSVGSYRSDPCVT